MKAVGLLFLGTFFGALCGISLRQLKSEAFQNVNMIASIASFAVAGAVLPFTKMISDDGNMIALYPVGLVLGIVFAYASVVQEKLNKKVLSVLHMVGIFLFVASILALLFSPELRSLLPSPDPTNR